MKILKKINYSDYDVLKIFLRFCKERNIYELLISQTNKNKLIKSIQYGRKSFAKNIIPCPLYLDTSVGFPSMGNTKEGYSFWYCDKYNEFSKWRDKDEKAIEFIRNIKK